MTVAAGSSAKTIAVISGESGYVPPSPYMGPGTLSAYAWNDSGLTLTTLTEGTDWQYDSGMVSLSPAAAEAHSGEKLVLIRRLPMTQDAAIPLAGRLDSVALEKALDASALRDQQLEEQLSRTLSVPLGMDVDIDALAAQFLHAITVVGNLENLTVAGTSTGLPGTSASVSLVDHRYLFFTIPQGAKGNDGTPATVAVGSVTTLPAGSAATVANTGGPSAAVFNFGIPRGSDGSPGTSATIEVGNVVTLPAGSQARVVNSGTSSAAVFDFWIPKGADGDAGSAQAVVVVDSVPEQPEDDGPEYILCKADGKIYRLQEIAGSSFRLQATSQYPDLHGPFDELFTLTSGSGFSRVWTSARGSTLSYTSYWETEPPYWTFLLNDGDSNILPPESIYPVVGGSGNEDDPMTIASWVGPEMGSDQMTVIMTQIQSGVEYVDTGMSVVGTASQLAALNSGITASKVATYDGYATGKADLVGGEVPSGQLPMADAYNKLGLVKIKSNSGLSIASGGAASLSYASSNQINARNTYYAAVVPGNLDYAVRSVSPLITALPSDAASPVALTDASATTRNHSYTYAHAPDTAPTYQLPAVSDATIAHEIVLCLDLTSTASFSFQDPAGNTIAVDTNGATPALGEKWTVWAEYLHGAWKVRGMKDMEATA